MSTEPPDDRFFKVLVHEPEVLRHRLFELMVHASLNRLPDARTANAREWSNRIREASRAFEIAPDRRLDDFILPYRRMWQMDRIDARMRDLARTWPEGHRPQAFVCGSVWEVDDHGVTGSRGSRIDVVSGMARPVMGGKAVNPPYLFMGVVGLEEGAATWACLHGHAQPIAAMNCPLPMESDAQRQAFGALQKTLAILRRELAAVKFTLEKPLFETHTQYGPCRPDFIIQALPEGWEGWESVRFMIEVTEPGDGDRCRRKEETHRAMRELGTLCVMEAARFGTREGLASEGTDVTDRVRAVLRRRMA